MVKGKLSQQLSPSSERGLPPRRETRTQRLRQQVRERRDTQKFQALKQRAEQVQRERFSKITSVKDYEREFNALSPELKSFFATPQQVRAGRVQRIGATKERVKAKLGETNQKLIDLQKKKNEALAKLRRSRDQASSSRERNNILQDINDDRDDFDEDREFLIGVRTGLREGLGSLDQGKDFALEDILSHADNVGDFRESREEAKNKRRGVEKKERKRIQDAIKEVELKGGSFQRITKSRDGVVQEQKVFAVVDGKFTLLSKAKPRKDFRKIARPSSLGTAKIAQSFIIGGRKITFEGQQQLFTEKATGELVTPFGSIGRKEADVLSSQQESIKAAERERKRRAKEFLSREDFETRINTPIEDKRSIFNKIVDVGKGVLAASPLGVGTMMPEEFLKQRRAISLRKPKIGLGVPGGIDLLTFDPKTAFEGVKAQRRKQKKAAVQVELIKELGGLTEKAPEDIQFEVQQRGRDLLKGIGIETKIDEKEGLIKFTSPELTPSRKFTELQLERAKNFTEKNLDSPFIFSVKIPARTTPARTLPTRREERKEPAGTLIVSPRVAAVRAEIIGVKAAEFFLFGKGIGEVSKFVRGGAKILGAGTRVIGTSVRAGKVFATIEEVQPSVAGTLIKRGGVVTVFATGGALFVAAKQEEKRRAEEKGSIAKEVFAFETIGEIAGLGALIGEGFAAKKLKRSTEALNRQIERENILRKKGALTEIGFEGVGGGTKLSPKEIELLSKLQSEVTGVSKKRAITILKESGLFKQRLDIRSPSGVKTPTVKRFVSVQSLKTTQGSKELALEFSRKGRRIQNVILKMSVGRGRFSLTSVFERTRRTKLKPDRKLRLQKLVISKIVKSESVAVSEGTISRSFDLEQRVAKLAPFGKERLEAEEAIKLGFPKLSEKELAKIFEKAGDTATTFPLLIKNIRGEMPKFRDVISGVKVANIEKEFDFAQVGRGRSKINLDSLLIFEKTLRSTITSNVRRAKLKNVLRDMGLEKLVLITSSRTPLSRTFGKPVKIPKGGIKETTASAVSKAAIKQAGEVTVKNVQISPSIQTDFKTRVIERLSAKAITKVTPVSRSAILSAVSGKLASRTKQQSKSSLISSLRSRQITQQAQVLQQMQQQQQQQRLKAVSVSVPNIAVPKLSIPGIPRIPTETTRPIIPTGAIAIFGARDRVERRLKKRGRKKGAEELFLLPDFTTRILGLTPQRVPSVKAALVEIKKIRTGLGLRRGLIIR